MPGSARLRPAAVAFALGEAIELKDNAQFVGQHSDLDPAAQTAQAERHHRRPQLGRTGDVAIRQSNVTLTSSLSCIVDAGMAAPRAGDARD